MILWASHLKSIAAVHFPLEPGLFSLGRSTGSDPVEKLAVPFDPKLSRRTARIEVKPTRLVVERDGSRAPIFVEGVQRDRFEIIPGQRFSVAETVFELVHELAQTVTAEEVEQARDGSSEQLLELMVAVQPLLAAEPSVEELVERVNEILPNSQVALFPVTPLQSLEEVALVPSKSLVAQACGQGEPVYHEWSGEQVAGQPTAAQGERWALAAPIVAGDVQLVLYAVGHRQVGNLERGGYCLLAQMLNDHFEARRVSELEAAQLALDQLRSDHDPKVRRATERVIRGEEEQVLLNIRSLGEFECYMEGERLDKVWGGKQLSWLLSYLACSPKAATEDSLLEAFWPDRAAQARKTLSMAVSRLRKYLQRGFDGDPIIRNHTGYALNDTLPYRHDYQEVEALLHLLEQRPAEAAVSSGKRLMELYRGPYLEGCYLEWAVTRRTELEQRLQEAFQFAAEAALWSENFEEALEFARRSLEFEPCSQSSHLVSLQAYLGLARPEQAIRHYEACERTLSRELGIEPSIELFKAYQKARLIV